MRKTAFYPQIPRSQDFPSHLCGPSIPKNMADFIESEAEESEEEEIVERRKIKRKAVEDSSEEEEDDEERLKEEMKDLIDDNPIDESEGEESDASGGEKRKKSDDEEFDDRLEDDDYDLIEENLGVKVQRRPKFKRLRRIQDNDSDNDDGDRDDVMDREHIARDLFSDDDEERRSERSHRPIPEPEQFNEEEEEEGDSDSDGGFIVDDEGKPISEKRKKKRPIFADAALQEAQETFGVDFDYDEFAKKNEDEYEEDEDDEEDEYEGEDEDGHRKQRAKKSTGKKLTRKSIFDVFEPIELKKGFFTDIDNEIRATDIPERMQIREVPITPAPDDSTELDEEADWIYKQAFCKATVSMQEYNTMNDSKERHRKGPQTIAKIKKALDFMRNQQLEVPFIAFYRKEYVQPELNINDLWRVYRWDSRWCALRQRKMNLLSIYEKMRNYQLDQLTIDPDAPLPPGVRIMKDGDLEHLRGVTSAEELLDAHRHFAMYYGADLNAMHAAWRTKDVERRKEERRAARTRRQEERELAGEDPLEDDPLEDDALDEEEPPENASEVKGANRGGSYALCAKAGIAGLAKKFGLSPSEFAENLRDNYQRHEVDQEAIEVGEVAKEYICSKFGTVDEVLQAAKYMVSLQIAREPLLRKCVREVFFERAKLNIKPTKKGLKVIDESHNLYSMKYVKNKPVRDLANDQYLKLALAEEDQLIEITIDSNIAGNTSNSYIDEVKQLYIRDEFSKNVQDWNTIRVECVERALTKLVLPDLIKELQRTLLAESKECVLRACCRKLYSWIKVAPYRAEFPDMEEDEDWDTTNGVRVMGIAYEPDPTQAAFACMAAIDGDVSDYLRLPHLLKRRNSFRLDEKQMKEADLSALRNFISQKRPHVVVIGGESREAHMIAEDLKTLVNELSTSEHFPVIAVEIVDNELAKVYANTTKGMADFREYPELLRQAVSLARKMQDPLIEFSQLCTPDNDLLSLRYHSLQEQIPKEELLENLELEFVNRTNEVGVDVNLAVQLAHKSHLIQFVCGLGPRKGQALLRVLKQTNQRLENRTQLVTACHMGPKVFINCSGFIKIDTNSLGDSTEAYVEILDGSRVHPETYEWARKMAVDALEYDDDEGANPASALEEILEAPERLKDLDLDAFAEELERQGFGNKSITLYDIRAELNHRYKDLRTPFATANPEELFDMLTKECPETFYIGKLITATVSGISRRKPQGEQLDQANPVRNEETGLWQCPFCLHSDFPEPSDVWNHFDAGACSGQATGVKLRLDNAISGYIHIKNLSDKHVANPEERVGVGQLLHARIIKIDVERFSVDCTSKSSDLADKSHEWRPAKDPYYDQDAEERDIGAERDLRKVRAKQTYVKRVIMHPSFHNISFTEAEKLMAGLDQGDVIIRPSSKGVDHLTITWKVSDGIYQHIDVREEGKVNAFSLGTSLWIGGEEFEDLDEIIARHVTPMAAHARDLLYFKYYRAETGGLKDKAEEFLRDERKKNSTKIHYVICACKNYPGKFMLSYLPRSKVRHELVTVSPDGFRFRQQMFDSVTALFKWFKEHFRDPVPGGGAMGQSTPGGGTPGHAPSGARAGNNNRYNNNSGGHTPGYNNMNSEAIQRVAQSLQPHMISTLSTITNHHPYSQQHPYPVNTPYTPSGQTPFLTPYQTTPRAYGVGLSTPSQQQQQLQQHGQFLHPGAITPSQQHHHGHHRSASASPMVLSSPAYSSSSHHGGSSSGSHRGSVYADKPSPRSGSRSSQRNHHSSAHHYSSNNSEAMDWQKAAEAWVRKTGGGGSTPRQTTPRYVDDGLNMESSSGRGSQDRMGRTGKSPRSARSTPRTNTSPHSMSLGDATPLYDENI